VNQAEAQPVCMSQGKSVYLKWCYVQLQFNKCNMQLILKA